MFLSLLRVDRAVFLGAVFYDQAAHGVQGGGSDIQLRFSFALVVTGVEGGSAQEKEYADSMTGDYLKAVAATLTAMRRIKSGEAVTA